MKTAFGPQNFQWSDRSVMISIKHLREYSSQVVGLIFISIFTFPKVLFLLDLNKSLWVHRLVLISKAYLVLGLGYRGDHWNLQKATGMWSSICHQFVFWVNVAKKYTLYLTSTSFYRKHPGRLLLNPVQHCWHGQRGVREECDTLFFHSQWSDH